MLYYLRHTEKVKNIGYVAAPNELAGGTMSLVNYNDTTASGLCNPGPTVTWAKRDTYNGSLSPIGVASTYEQHFPTVLNVYNDLVSDLTTVGMMFSSPRDPANLVHLFGPDLYVCDMTTMAEGLAEANSALVPQTAAYEYDCGTLGLTPTACASWQYGNLVDDIAVFDFHDYDGESQDGLGGDEADSPGGLNGSTGSTKATELGVANLDDSSIAGSMTTWCTQYDPSCAGSNFSQLPIWITEMGDSDNVLSSCHDEKCEGSSECPANAPLGTTCAFSPGHTDCDTTCEYNDAGSNAWLAAGPSPFPYTENDPPLSGQMNPSAGETGFIQKAIDAANGGVSAVNLFNSSNLYEPNSDFSGDGTTYGTQDSQDSYGLWGPPNATDGYAYSAGYYAWKFLTSSTFGESYVYGSTNCETNAYCGTDQGMRVATLGTGPNCSSNCSTTVLLENTDLGSAQTVTINLNVGSPLGGPMFRSFNEWKVGENDNVTTLGSETPTEVPITPTAFGPTSGEGAGGEGLEIIGGTVNVPLNPGEFVVLRSID